MNKLSGTEPTQYIEEQEVDWVGSYDREKSDPAPTTIKTKHVEYTAGPYTKEELLGHKKNQVHEPTHYEIFPGTQVIEVIKSVLTEEEFKGFCKGNILKYRLRDKQDREEDYEKSKKYQSYMQDI